jgi:hypothetical protein
MDSPILQVHYKPRIPEKTDYGIGIVGCGGIVNYAHLPAYKAHKLNIVACYDINADSAGWIHFRLIRTALPPIYGLT